mgnify:CR=1 FL=1
MDVLEVTRHEARRKIMVIDSKSFYASVESVDRQLNPLKSLLVVMSQQANTNGGLVLAASPRAKAELGISNVMRQRDVPKDPRLMIVNPRMNRYIEMNKKVNDIFRRFVAEEDLHLYSIDESILDVTDSWQYWQSKFGKNLTLKGLARQIQLAVKQELGLYLTVGIGDTPAMAKLALDLEAKHDFNLMGEWHFEDLPNKLWPITNLEDVWSIGRKTAQTLKRLGIFSMKDLALYNPYQLKEKLGVRGEELYALSWGVDRSILHQRHYVKDASISNSQVLPRDYQQADEIKVVIREIGEQISGRLRSQHKMARSLSLSVGYSYATSQQKRQHGFNVQTTITATNQSHTIAAALLELFDCYYESGAVRNIGVSAGQLQAEHGEQLDLLTPVREQVNRSKLDNVIDDIRRKFGVTSLVKLSSLSPGGTMIQRAGLVGGHNGGNAYGQ